jgi:hypothetical protein
MDLLSIMQTIWRHRIATIPVIALTVLGCFYVVAVKAPVYEATASYILFDPPAPPTPEEIAADPALGRIKTDNPYTRFGEQSVVVDVLSRTMSADAARQALIRKGADSRYIVQGSASFGMSSPIIQITGVGSSSKAALDTATIVSNAVKSELDRMQAAYGTDARYRIKPLQIDFPDRAQLRASGKIRMLVGVLALGGILIFLVVSFLNGVAEWRSQGRVEGAEQEGPAPSAGATAAGGSDGGRPVVPDEHDAPADDGLPRAAERERDLVRSAP